MATSRSRGDSSRQGREKSRPRSRPAACRVARCGRRAPPGRRRSGCRPGLRRPGPGPGGLTSRSGSQVWMKPSPLQRGQAPAWALGEKDAAHRGGGVAPQAQRPPATGRSTPGRDGFPPGDSRRSSWSSSVTVPTRERGLRRPACWGTATAARRPRAETSSAPPRRGSSRRAQGATRSANRFWASASRVSNTREDLPQPEGPVTTVRPWAGKARSRPRRLWVVTPVRTMGGPVPRRREGRRLGRAGSLAQPGPGEGVRAGGDLRPGCPPPPPGRPGGRCPGPGR